MADSTKSSNISLLDQGSAIWQLHTRYNSTDDTHIPLVASRDWEHQLIHEGKVFQLSGRITGLGIGASAYLLGITDGANIHFRAASLISDSAPLDIGLYEDATVSANGTQIFAKNKNRQVSDTHTLLVYSGPTVTGEGTQLEDGFVPITGGGNAGGYADLFESEWVLDSSSKYLIKITNNDVQTAIVNYNFLWYEL